MKTHANVNIQTHYATKVKLQCNCLTAFSFSSEYCYCYFHFYVCIYLFNFVNIWILTLRVIWHCEDKKLFLWYQKKRILSQVQIIATISLLLIYIAVSLLDWKFTYI